jgi:hypothetical protein
MRKLCSMRPTALRSCRVTPWPKHAVMSNLSPGDEWVTSRTEASSSVSAPDGQREVAAPDHTFAERPSMVVGRPGWWLRPDPVAGNSA